MWLWLNSLRTRVCVPACWPNSSCGWPPHEHLNRNWQTLFLLCLKMNCESFWISMSLLNWIKSLPLCYQYYLMLFRNCIIIHSLSPCSAVFLILWHGRFEVIQLGTGHEIDRATFGVYRLAYICLRSIFIITLEIYLLVCKVCFRSYNYIFWVY